MLGDSDKDAEVGTAVGLMGKKIEPSSILSEVRAILGF
jgi:hypothetical protein